MDKFLRAFSQWEQDEREKDVIGRLMEKPLHAILKNYISPDINNQEIKIGSFFADAVVDGEIFEIQTGNFNVIRKKLEYFLKENKVTIIYPVSKTNRICWIDPETAEVKKGRISPQKGNAFFIFPQLYKIKPFLKNPNLSFRVILLDTEEYRLLDGYSEDRKKGGKKLKKLPINIIEEIPLENLAQYLSLLKDIDGVFTTADFKKKFKLSQKIAQCSINILYYLGVIIRIGKKGNAFLYQKAEIPNEK
ncbi:MAG: hypothetical protein IKZ25_01535 [Clostridia bacterium]|nr:hypothetical protein [Clostridia bacterium]